MNDVERADVAGVTALLEQFQRELLVLVQADRYATAPHVVFSGLLELIGLMARNFARLEPDQVPTLLHQLDLLRQHVETAADEPRQAPATQH
jgi:hypothetical protein